MTTFSVALPNPAHEMAREEIRKQVAFVSRDIQNVRFSKDGSQIYFEAPDAAGPAVEGGVRNIATKIERALRNLERKIVFASAAAASPRFAKHVNLDAVHFLGTGQAALSGLPLRLFRYFDRVFEAFGDPWNAEPVRTPTLIPSTVLSRCDYFRSFPQNVTFAAHLHEDPTIIDGFRSRHQKLNELDDAALGDMDRPEACLSPAVCYHIYHLNENRQIPASGLAYGICGKCFRYESSNISDLRRLWDFTMREVVFLGGRDYVLEQRDKSILMMSSFLDSHELAGEIRTASDPFFVAPDAVTKTFFQLSSDSKFEVSLMLPEGERTAVGSHNYHSDFFGRAFSTTVAGSDTAMHSVCMAFGLERWVYAFLMQHGSELRRWPGMVRSAPEFAGLV
jgi:seryl-tRNA synthetase